jgi:hypothetical protein
MGNTPVRNEQRRANDEAHEARVANFQRSEAAAKARRETAAKPKPTAEDEVGNAKQAQAKQAED